MKKVLQILSLVLVLSGTYSCTKENTEPGSDEQIIFNGNQIGSGVQEFEITKNHVITKGTYVLKGWVYVTDGATLTIEAGTVIKGDKDTKAALVIERGGKLIAQGTASKPIVFTSNQAPGSRRPGDWGGLVILGRAKNNKTEMIIEGGLRSSHGGSNDADNSGIISYVRVEFAGYPFATDQEINGVTLGSVGNGTQFDHVQVSYSNDDSFEFFGGSVNGKYLVAYHGWDDDFDTDNGYSGKLQFGLGVRNPMIADVSRSHGFESDNEANGTALSPLTKPIFSNFTLIGPIGQDASFQNNSSYITGGSFYPNNGSKLGNFQSAMLIRRSSNLNCYNSVATGYPVGIMICNDKGSQTQSYATAGSLNIKRCYIAGMTITGSDKDNSFADLYSSDATNLTQGQESFSSAYFKNSSNGNTILGTIGALYLAQPNSLIASPNYGPASSSPLTGRISLFADTQLNDSFFDKVDFIGAFRSSSSSDNWMTGWTNFNPQSTVY